MPGNPANRRMYAMRFSWIWRGFSVPEKSKSDDTRSIPFSQSRPFFGPETFRIRSQAYHRFLHGGKLYGTMRQIILAKDKHCQESWTLERRFLEKPLSIWLLPPKICQRMNDENRYPMKLFNLFFRETFSSPHGLRNEIPCMSFDQQEIPALNFG